MIPEPCPYAVEMRGITMRFPSVTANSDVDFFLKKGEIHALVGENGAGKSTLMNILYGLLVPTEGEIYVNGEKVNFTSALSAINAGIGMVHQHFTLIPRLTVAENIVLGAEPRTKRGFLDRKKAVEEEEGIRKRFGLNFNSRDTVSSISLNTMQKVEIAKALYRNADTLILDEPTAMLTPQEIDELGVILRNLKSMGKSIIIITHKLREVMAFSDRITVLRGGRIVGTVQKEESSPDAITRMMVGHDVSISREKSGGKEGKPVLELRNVSYRSKIRNVSLTLHSGEIVGVAGIDDNGQKELTEIAAGIITPDSGTVLLDGEDITGKGTGFFKDRGIGFIPQDRTSAGLFSSMEVWENLVLGYQRKRKYRKALGVMDGRKMVEDAAMQIEKYDIRPRLLDVAAGKLSGGNQQKVIVARESERAERVIVADQPSRGVDVGAMELIYKVFDNACDAGRAVLVSSLELDEIMTISDRIVVMAEGRITGIVRGKDADRFEIGKLMLKEEEK